MSDSWKSVPVKEVKVGDVVRVGPEEIIVSRIEPGFLGMDSMLAFIEDTSVRWLKCPQPVDGQVDVKAS
jgi:hypothetical protein